jgi:hypothetical protein
MTQAAGNQTIKQASKSNKLTKTQSNKQPMSLCKRPAIKQATKPA